MDLQWFAMLFAVFKTSAGSENLKHRRPERLTTSKIDAQKGTNEIKNLPSTTKDVDRSRMKIDKVTSEASQKQSPTAAFVQNIVAARAWG